MTAPRLEFGRDVPCRYCALRGKVTIRTEKGKRKRVECPVCHGAGYLPVKVADRTVAL